MRLAKVKPKSSSSSSQARSLGRHWGSQGSFVSSVISGMIAAKHSISVNVRHSYFLDLHPKELIKASFYEHCILQI
jgi:hypothetical protein